MTPLTKHLIPALLFWLCSPAFAQIDMKGVGNRVLQKGAEKTGEKIEERAEDEADEQLDKLFEKKIGNKKEGGQGDEGGNKQSNKGFQGLSKYLGNQCTPKSTYSYQDDFVMKVSSKTSAGDEEQGSTIRCYVGSTTGELAYRFEEFTGKGSEKMDGLMMIMDPIDSMSVMLMENDGTKMGFCSKGYQQPGQEPGNNNSKTPQNDAEWRKTGRSERIAGILCYEYLREQGTQTQSAWVASDGAPVSDLLRAMQGNKQLGVNQQNTPEGDLMRMITKDSKSGEETFLEISEINKGSRKSISTAGFTFQ